MRVLQMFHKKFYPSHIQLAASIGEGQNISHIYLQDGSHKDWQTSQNKHKGSSDSLFPEIKSKDYQSTSCFSTFKKDYTLTESMFG